MKTVCPTLLRASDAIDLREQVAKAIAGGKDMYAPLFSDYGGLLCQFVVPGFCLYEYRLIEALDLDDLETQAQSLTLLGFDFMFNTVLWQGKYLQWMQRMSERGEFVKGMIVSALSDDGTVELEDQAQELTLVEDAREALRFESVSFAWAAPYPLATA